MGPIWSKAIDYLMQNARALLEAPLVFVAVLALAFGASYWINGLRFQGSIDTKSSTIENLKNQIDMLQTKIVDIQKNFDSKPTGARPSISAPDPDGIFQLGIQVGTVRLPQVDESRGVVFFAAIVGAVNFNAGKDFDYRGFVLHTKSIGTESLVGMAGDVKRALGQVSCEIIARKAAD